VAWSGSLGFAVFRFVLFVPTAKIERDSHAGGAQFVRKSTVDHGTSHDHASEHPPQPAKSLSVPSNFLPSSAVSQFPTRTPSRLAPFTTWSYEHFELADVSCSRPQISIVLDRVI